MIRLGLIGAGAWGKNYITAAKESGVAEVVWIVGREWQSAFSYKVDAFIVATPPEPRAKICLLLSERGHPMMVEKPLCLSLSEIETIRSAIPPAVPFLVDYVHLFSPAYEILRMLVRERTGHVRIYSHSAGPTVRTYSTMWDHTPHDLAMILGLGLDLDTAHFAINRGRHVDCLDVHFDDASAHLCARISPDKSKQFVVFVGSWGAVYDGVEGKLYVNGQPYDVLEKERPLTRAVRAFAKAVADGGTDDWRFGIDSSIAITRVLEQAHQAAGAPHV